MNDLPPDNSLNGKVALISAGASGIGREIARQFLDAGLQVHVCDVDETAVQDFLTAFPKASATVANVADVASVDAVYSVLESRYGRLDVLVNNAGIAGPTAAVEDIAPEDWDQTIRVDLNSAFYMTRKAVPLLKQAGGGSIINMASNAAFFGFPWRSPYTASKWALVGLSKTWAMELGPSGIRVNALCPGSVNGQRIEQVIERDAKLRGSTPEAIRELYARQSSLRCFVDAADVAAMALFLVSDAGARISGQALGIDGHTESLSDI